MLIYNVLICTYGIIGSVFWEYFIVGAVFTGV